MLTWPAKFETIVRSVLSRLGSDDALCAETVMLDFGLDSMKTIDLVIQLEQAFEILIPDDLLAPETFKTPASLWNVVESLLKLGGAHRDEHS